MGINEFCNRHRKAVNSAVVGITLPLALGVGSLFVDSSDLKSIFGRKSGLEACVEPVQEQARMPKKRAIVICQDFVVLDEARLMLDVLNKRGYAAQYIGTTAADEKEIFGALEKIAADSANGDKTVFYFSGHGDNYYGQLQGICVNKKTSEGEGIIRALFLLDKLAKIKGQKAAMFDCCYSGVHTELAEYSRSEGPIPEDLKNYLIIAACPSDKKAVYDGNYLPGKNIGALTFALYNLLNSNGEVNLSKAPIKPGTEWQRNHTKEYAESVGVNADEISFEAQRVSDCDFKL